MAGVTPTGHPPGRQARQRTMEREARRYLDRVAPQADPTLVVRSLVWSYLDTGGPKGDPLAALDRGELPRFLDAAEPVGIRDPAELLKMAERGDPIAQSAARELAALAIERGLFMPPNLQSFTVAVLKQPAKAAPGRTALAHRLRDLLLLRAIGYLTGTVGATEQEAVDAVSIAMGKAGLGSLAPKSLRAIWQRFNAPKK